MARKMLKDGEPDLNKGAEEGTNFDFDLFIIGAGSGGVRAARFSSNHGAKVRNYVYSDPNILLFINILMLINSM